jgi:hypothetical protein
MAGSGFLVEMFRFNGSNWVEDEKLMASAGAEGDSLGFSVAVPVAYVFDEPVPVPSLGPLGMVALLSLLGLAGWQTLRASPDAS